MTYPIVLDLETQHAFQEVGYDHKKLKISVVGIYDFASDNYEVYTENELTKLYPRLEHASHLIGFNIRKFDLPVMSAYYLGNVNQFPVLDLLDEVERALGFRVALDDLARATLDTKKSGHGLMAINYYKLGKIEELKKYCLDDVRITKSLYEFGRKNRKVYFISPTGKREIPVEFDLKTTKSSVSLSLPF